MRSMDAYFDVDGMLTFLPDHDGSASAQLHAIYRFGQSIKYKDNFLRLQREKAKYNQELDALEDLSNKKKEYIGMGPGCYKIHPTDPRYTNPKKFPSIYHRSTVIAMGGLRLKDRLKDISIAQLKRGGFYQDGKYITPTAIAEYIRAYAMINNGFKLLWPIVFALDFFGMFGIEDTDNQCLTVLQARLSMPTPFSYIARKKFSLMHNTTGDNDTVPPVKEQYESIIKELL